MREALELQTRKPVEKARAAIGRKKEDLLLRASDKLSEVGSASLAGPTTSIVTDFPAETTGLPRRESDICSYARLRRR